MNKTAITKVNLLKESSGFKLNPLIVSTAKRLLKNLDMDVGYIEVIGLEDGTIKLDWSEGIKYLELYISSETSINFEKGTISIEEPETGTVSVKDVKKVEEMVRWVMKKF